MSNNVNVSSNRVMGQQVKISFDKGDGSVAEYLGLVDNFSYQFDDVVKTNAALGQAGKGTIDVLNDGGTGSFECKQSDAILTTFFINQAVHQRGGANTYSVPTTGQRGRTPYYVVEMTTTFVDDLEMTLKFYGVLHNYNGSVGGNKEEFSEKWQFTFDYVTFAVTGAGAAVDAGIDMVSLALANINTMDGGNDTPFDYSVVQPN